ncbi:MAG: chromosome partitioning protein ParB, partial [Novosphingobium meiothermophilum]
RDMSVRDAEKLVRKASRPEGTGGRRQARAGKDSVGAADLAAIQQHLEDFLGLKVSIQPDADPTSGAVVIRYRNLDQLDLICQRLTGGEF